MEKELSKTFNKLSGSKSSAQKQEHTDAHRDYRGSLDKLTDYDLWATEALAVCANETRALHGVRWLLIALEFSCHGIPWLVGTFIAIFVSHQRRTHEILLNLFAALLFDLVVVGITKGLVRRERPALNKMDMFGTVSVDKFSFPSGHTTRAMMVSVFLMSQLSLGAMGNNCIVVWACCVAVSRIMLGRHHVFDVFCGGVFGILQYYIFAGYLWISEQRCDSIIRPLQEDLHL